MTTYAFKVTKGRYQLSLTTTDREMVVEQFEKWVRGASNYVQTNKEHDTVVHPAISKFNAEKELTQKKIDEQLKRIPKPEPAAEEKPVEELTKEEETQRDLDTIYASSPVVDGEAEVVSAVKTEKHKEQTAFDAILDKSMQMPQDELSFTPNPSIKKDNAFLNYIGGRKVERKIDYLLMTAYYFTQYEQKPRFTLKQLNAKLMQNLAIILDHSVVQEAINRDYIECLPDLTGVVGASEYRLTAYGEKTLLESE